jgi:hypothetical protein
MFIEGRDGRADGDGPEAEFVPWFVCTDIDCDSKVFDREGDCPVHGKPLAEVDEHGREVT